MERFDLKSVKRIGGAVVGIALVAAAVVLASRGVAWRVLFEAPGWVLPLIAVGVGVNLLATTGLMWVITRGFATTRPVGYREMVAVIAWSGLLNYVPVIRAGLWGRAAYLKRTHGLALRDSVVILLITLALAALVLGTVGTVGLMLQGVTFGFTVGGVGVCLTLGLPWLVRRATPLIAGTRRVPGEAPRDQHVFDVNWSWPSAWVPLRLLDLAAAAGRLWLGFYAVGHTVTCREVVVLSCASLLVKLTGLTPNGLGLSEWVVAALAAALSPISAASAAGAALVDRAVEVIIAVAAGLIGWGVLRRWSRGDDGGAADVNPRAESITTQRAD